MVIPGAILVVAGSTIVLGCAIFWAWSAYRQKRLSGLARVQIIHPRSQHHNTSCANMKHYRGRMLGQKYHWASS